MKTGKRGTESGTMERVRIMGINIVGDSGITDSTHDIFQNSIFYLRSYMANIGSKMAIKIKCITAKYIRGIIHHLETWNGILEGTGN